MSHLNPLEIHLDRITKMNENMANYLDYEGIKSPVSKKDYSMIEQKNNICINVFCYENDLICLLYISDQHLKTVWIYC